MLDSNPDIDDIISNAMELAKSYKHDYVTLEHLSVALINNKSFQDVLGAQAVDIDGLRKDLLHYLDSHDGVLIRETSDDVMPKKTHTLERVFNRAFTQVLFSARQRMEVIDLYLSIAQETNSHACYFFIKWGCNRRDLVETFNKQFPVQARSKKTGKRTSKDFAKQILEEHCEDLNQMVKDGKIEPLIGRALEIEEITQVLARKNKSNVLMIGDPGVGKTAVAEGLAYKIVNQDVPEYLKEYTVYNLEIGSLLAGS